MLAYEGVKSILPSGRNGPRPIRIRTISPAPGTHDSLLADCPLVSRTFPYDLGMRSRSTRYWQRAFNKNEMICVISLELIG